MIIDLNNEAVDGIVKSILIQDYKSLCSDIINLESAKELPEYKQQDLEHNYRYRNAMEILLEFYVGFNWKDQM